MEPRTTTLRYYEAHQRTNFPIFRGYWDFHRKANPGYSEKLGDSVYLSLIKKISTHYSSVCEIGCDLGRSTGWLSDVAFEIDVYDNNKEYLEFCKQQCYNHQKRYSKITNVNWHNTENKGIGEVIQKLPKQYDAIKLVSKDIERYMPLLKQKLKKTGHLFLYEQDQFLRPSFIMNIEKYGFELANSTTNTVLIVKHK